MKSFANTDAYKNLSMENLKVNQMTRKVKELQLTFEMCKSQWRQYKKRSKICDIYIHIIVLIKSYIICMAQVIESGLWYFRNNTVYENEE